MSLKRLGLFGCVWLLAACASAPTIVTPLPNTPPPGTAPVMQAAPPANTPSAPTLAPTLAPPTAIPPTSAPLPPAPLPPAPKPPAPEPPAIPISFQPGGTSAAAEGNLPANGTATYVLGLLGGRYFQVAIESPITLGSLGLSGADGSVLLSPAAGQRQWRGVLPATQNYFVQVVSSGPASYYMLSFIAPAPLAFAPGGTSLAVQGSVGPNQIQYYVLPAQANQFAIVTINSPEGSVLLTMYGLQDGQPLTRSASGSPTYQGVLPATQDYMIQAVSSGVAANYTLQVIIPLRIQFAPGGVAATYNGAFNALGTDFYILHAQAGQTLSVNIAAPQNNVLLTIYGIQDGQPLIRSVSGATSFNGVLPGTQDYMIEAVGIGPGTYTMDVAVP